MRPREANVPAKNSIIAHITNTDQADMQWQVSCVLYDHTAYGSLFQSGSPQIAINQRPSDFVVLLPLMLSSKSESPGLPKSRPLPISERYTNQLALINNQITDVIVQSETPQRRLALKDRDQYCRLTANVVNVIFGDHYGTFRGH